MVWVVQAARVCWNDESSNQPEVEGKEREFVLGIESQCKGLKKSQQRPERMLSPPSLPSKSKRENKGASRGDTILLFVEGRQERRGRSYIQRERPHRRIIKRRRGEIQRVGSHPVSGKRERGGPEREQKKTKAPRENAIPLFAEGQQERRGRSCIQRERPHRRIIKRRRGEIL